MIITAIVCVVTAVTLLAVMRWSILSRRTNREYRQWTVTQVRHGDEVPYRFEIEATDSASEKLQQLGTSIDEFRAALADAVHGKPDQLAYGEGSTWESTQQVIDRIDTELSAERMRQLRVTCQHDGGRIDMADIGKPPSEWDQYCQLCGALIYPDGSVRPF